MNRGTTLYSGTWFWKNFIDFSHCHTGTFFIDFFYFHNETAVCQGLNTIFFCKPYKIRNFYHCIAFTLADHDGNFCSFRNSASFAWVEGNNFSYFYILTQFFFNFIFQI